MSLDGKVVFVAGASGIVGSGIVICLLKEKAKVWVASRSKQNLEELKSKLDDDLKSRLICLNYDVSNENECIAIRDEILKTDKKINHVFSSLGGWWISKDDFSEQSLDEFMSVHKTMVVSHFVVYKTFAKHLANEEASTYTFITGGSGESNEAGEIFEPKASLINVFGPAVYGLVYAARNEFNGKKNLNICELRINVWVKKLLDQTLDQSNEHLVGHDYIGKFAVKICQNHGKGTYKIKTRSEGSQVYATM